ncbi:site-specific DNA-methyltransferase [Brevundimonas sp. MEB006b]|uniref:site-specific DNA-methyltransferase n=1 Tax=Brevundimonas sp. MEB006b TaxID=3040283 RepID=UPI00254F2F29|nr:site-specific DNA-methyltransferase [Brevundimonas sp. MEB006b]
MTIEKLDATTPDLTRQNIARLAELFPECVTEGPMGSASDRGEPVIDFDLLRQALTDHLVEGPQERYRLDWPGKRQALLTANAPIDKTLRPMREDSVQFDTTFNLFIEGDNLDALKLLQETYLGQIKIIYIDPPYNTGKDFIYRDNFAQSRGSYEAETAQRDEDGGRLVANPETTGRFHSNWLNMMYPRLKLARNLLRDDGLMLISIDDFEQSQLRRIADEVFGEGNFIAEMPWEKGRKNDAKLFSVGHEYMLVYAKNLAVLKERKEIWREEKPGAREIWDEFVRLRKQHGSSHGAIEKELGDWFTALPKGHPSKKWARYKRVDANGPWRDRDISWPGGDGPTYDVIHPRTNLPCVVPEAGWRYASPDEMDRQIKLGLVEFREDHTNPPFRKAHLRPVAAETFSEPDDEEESGEEEELATQVRPSVIYKQSQVAVKHLRALMGAKVFTNPKDHEELAALIGYMTANDPDAVVLDFFAGSGSLAEAVIDANIRFGGQRKFVVVQLPQGLEETLASSTGTARTTTRNAIKYLQTRQQPLTLSALSRERIKRAGLRAVERNSSVDVGFRAFRIDSGNFQDTRVAPNQATQATLDGLISHIKDDRTDEDLLFGALLRWGVDITLPLRRQDLLGRTVWIVDPPTEGEAGAALIACFARPENAEGGIDTELADAMAAMRPLRVLFRDDGFASDAVKENVASRFKQRAPDTAVKVL